MKTIRVLIGDVLLVEFDETAEVQGKGRSAVLRQLTSDYLRLRRSQAIDAQYERAYEGVEEPLGSDFAGWEEEGESNPSSTWIGSRP
jgi:hypothetical protein